MVAKVRCKRPRKDAHGNPCDCGRYLGEVEGKFSLLCPLCHWITVGDSNLPRDTWVSVPKFKN